MKTLYPTLILDQRVPAWSSLWLCPFEQSEESLGPRDHAYLEPVSLPPHTIHMSYALGIKDPKD